MGYYPPNDRLGAGAGPLSDYASQNDLLQNSLQWHAKKDVQTSDQRDALVMLALVRLAKDRKLQRAFMRVLGDDPKRRPF